MRTHEAANAGLGFAAPSNIVRAVYEQIRKFGRVRRGDVGIRAQTVTPELAAGLDGKPMENGRQLRVNVYRRLVGDVVSLDIVRDG